MQTSAGSTSSGGLIILATFILGLILSQMPLPDALEWGRPEWLAMIVIYWVLVLPHRVGVGSAFVAGLVLDLLKGSVLGLSALSLTVIAFLTYILHQRIRMFPLWQQAVIVMILVGINQLIFHWMQNLIGTTGNSLLFLLPCLTSGLLWPWVSVMLGAVQRIFRIS